MSQLTAHLFFAPAQRLLGAFAFSDVMDNRKEATVATEFEPLARDCDRSCLARFPLHRHLKVTNPISFFQNHLCAATIRRITEEVKEIPTFSDHFVPLMAKQCGPAVIDLENDIVVQACDDENVRAC